MKKTLSVHVAGEELVLHPFRAVYWPSRSIMLLADLHLGKEHHFRKEGIPIPFGANDSTLSRLHHLLKFFQPQKVIILGDLFHSDYNYGWEKFHHLVKAQKHIQFELVAGNHDILHPGIYEESKIHLRESTLILEPFCFSHKPSGDTEDGYKLAGHIHPGIRMRGLGRQSLRLPCFWFGSKQGILPAFGSFTGLGIIHPTKEDQVIAIVNNEAILVSDPSDST
jgi:DNA ligase-associated metallophosphoesterase